MGTVIYTGPQGCGKSANQHAIAQQYGCKQIVDEWEPGDPITTGALHLTHLPIVQSEIGRRAIVVHHHEHALASQPA